ncbi:MAG: ral secretion pathway protein [Candidatus Binatota bacterium]|jgi:general secretion pathway protein L|nr:ral secretion pathway protein [Candidatus Binatota bacterium]
MPNRILALDVAGAKLTAVAVESSFRSYRVTGYASEPRDAERPLAEQLKSFLTRHGWLSVDTALSALPASSVAYRVLVLPFRDRRRLAQTVPFEIENLVPFALEDAVVDFHVLSREGDGARVFAALVPRAVMTEHLVMLADAGLDPAIVDFAPLSTLNVLTLFDGERPNRFAFLHLNGAHGTIALYRAGTLEAVRALELPSPVASEDLVREVCWSLRSFDGVPPGGGDDELALLIGGAAPTDLPDALRTQMALTIQRLEELPLKNVPAELGEQHGIYAPALGLALREVVEVPTVGLNFRRGEFAYQRGQQELKSAFGRLGLLATVVFLLFLVAEGLAYYRLSSRYEELRGAVQTVFRSVMPTVPAVDEVAQLTQEIASLRKRQEQLGVPEGGPVSVLELLREVALRAPAEPRLMIDEMTLDPEALRLRGKTASFEAVEAAKKSLAEYPLFRNVQVKDPRTTPDGSVEFRLNIPFTAPAEPASGRGAP